MKVTRKIHQFAEVEKCPMDGKETAFVVIFFGLKAIIAQYRFDIVLGT